MTERKFQAKVLKRLRTHAKLKEAVVYKHTDFRTGGIPDVSVTLGRNTTWFELKVAPKKPTKLQAHYLQKLERSCVVTLDPETKEVVISYHQPQQIWAQQILAFDEAIEYVVELCCAA